MCDSSCSVRTCVWLSILFGAIFGVAAALAYAFMPCFAADIITWMIFCLSVLALLVIAILLGHAFHSGEGRRSCLCDCGSSLIWAAFGSMVVSLIAMSLVWCCSIANIILFGLAVAFFAAMLTSLLRTMLCVVHRLCDRPRTRRDVDDDEDYRR